MLRPRILSVSANSLGLYIVISRLTDQRLLAEIVDLCGASDTEIINFIKCLDGKNDYTSFWKRGRV